MNEPVNQTKSERKLPGTAARSLNSFAGLGGYFPQGSGVAPETTPEPSGPQVSELAELDVTLPRDIDGSAA